MKKALTLTMVLALLMSGCAFKKYCFISPWPSEDTKVSVGSIMIKKSECVGRLTVNDCMELELIYLGRTHPENRIRIVSRVGNGTPMVTEATYPEDSKIIHYKDAEIEVIEVNDNWIRFRPIISTVGCDKVNGQEVK